MRDQGVRPNAPQGEKGKSERREREERGEGGRERERRGGKRDQRGRTNAPVADLFPVSLRGDAPRAAAELRAEAEGQRRRVPALGQRAGGEGGGVGGKELRGRAGHERTGGRGALLQGRR